MFTLRMKRMTFCNSPPQPSEQQLITCTTTRTHPLLVDAHASAADDVHSNAVTRHALEDIEVTGVMVSFTRDCARLVRIPDDDVSV